MTEEQEKRWLEASETESQRGEPRVGAVDPGQGAKGLSDVGAGVELTHIYTLNTETLALLGHRE